MAYVESTNNPCLLDEAEVSAMLKRSVKTLRNWRSAGRELPFVKQGSRVSYLKADILEYIARNRRVPSVRASSRIAHDAY